MGSNIGTLLSMVFVVLFFVFGVDIMSLQGVYTKLDQVAVTFGYVISKAGNINENTINEYCEKYDVEFMCISSCNPKVGDIVDYRLSTYYVPLVISKDTMKVTIERSTVIGIYN